MIEMKINLGVAHNHKMSPTQLPSPTLEPYMQLFYHSATANNSDFNNYYEITNGIIMIIMFGLSYSQCIFGEHLTSVENFSNFSTFFL